MKELGSGLYLDESSMKIYKLVPATFEELQAYIATHHTQERIYDPSTAAYAAESIRNLDKYRARRDDDIIGGRGD